MHDILQDAGFYLRLEKLLCTILIINRPNDLLLYVVLSVLFQKLVRPRYIKVCFMPLIKLPHPSLFLWPNAEYRTGLLGSTEGK